jgi:hypothetical protein
LAATGVAGTKKEDSAHWFDLLVRVLDELGMQFAYQQNGYASSNGRKTRWQEVFGHFLRPFGICKKSARIDNADI